MGKRKIIFSHSRAVGDCLMFTSGVRDFKLLFPDIEINVDSNFPEIWENNPYLSRSLKRKDEGVEYYKVGYPIINNSNNANTHFTQGFLFDMIAIADLHSPLNLPLSHFCSAFANGRIGDPDIESPETEKYRNICREFARQRPDIHLSDEEKSTNIVKEIYGFDKYWVIAPGGKRDCTTKIWDWRRFQKVIDYFDGLIKFVVIGKSDHLVEKLNGVIDLVDKFNDSLRGLFPLVYHSDGCVSGVSFLMHLAAGIPSNMENNRRSRKPCVAIYGGREPTTFTCYTNHQVLHTNGSFNCCDNGGCWQSRIIPLPKDPDKNTRMCHHTVVRNGRTIQSCMDTITSNDVIRGIEKYYEGNIYRYSDSKKKEKKDQIVIKEKIEFTKPIVDKEINILASLQSSGGGEQSALKIADLLRSAGWTVNFYPWADVHENYRKYPLERLSFFNGNGPNIDFKKTFKRGIPLLFYANDQIWDFVDNAAEIVNNSSDLIIGINYCNGSLPKSRWISKSGKLKGIVFQNKEKRDEFKRDQVGFDDVKLVTLFGAIDLDKFIEVNPAARNGGDIVVLKHCKPDWRKYITSESENTGEKIHIWQKHIFKERDTRFYERLLNDIPGVRFEFMEAHPELVNRFKNDSRMVFHKWDSMPVTDFLSRGHVYLYRTSNKWRDQYPRVVGEALAAGLPVLTEPRDGTRDRVDNGNTGIHCIDYDGFCYALKLLKRKEKMRSSIGMNAKDWARKNLDPSKWVTVIEELLSESRI